MTAAGTVSPGVLAKVSPHLMNEGQVISLVPAQSNTMLTNITLSNFLFFPFSFVC